jgi:phage RecT family recombinase
MNAVTKLEQFRQEVLPPMEEEQLKGGLPAHIEWKIFERNLLNCLMQNPKLLSFPARLVYGEVCKAAGLGLLLDPQLGEGYIVGVWNGKLKKEVPQFRVGYRGLCKLARQAGGVTGIYAHEVYEKDHIVCHLGSEKRLEHHPHLFGDRGQVIGYYAVITFSDGTSDFEPMSVGQTREIRDRSAGWKSYQEKKIKTTPWATDEVEMSKKTVIRRLMKRQPQSPELAEAFRREDEAEHPEMRNVTPLQERLGAVADAMPSPKDIDKAETEAAVQLIEAGRDDGAEVIWDENGPPGPEQVDQVQEKPEEKFLASLEAEFGTCGDMVGLGQAQVKQMMPFAGKVSEPAWEQAKVLVEKHARRIMKMERA